MVYYPSSYGEQPPSVAKVTWLEPAARISSCE
jgi:hypothetical protein